MKEPLIHSHITDMLDDDHQWSYEYVYCCVCGVMVHAGNNECMQTWVEYQNQAWCIECFGKDGRAQVLK